MKLEGEIGELDLIERLVELGRERFTGAVRFENDGIIKIIYFKAGDVLSASTNDRTDSVDEILLRAGKVSRDHVKQALAKRKESETLGDALLTLGFITKKELTWARRVQVIGVIRSIAAWPAGSFQIVPDYLPRREEGTQFPLQPILLEVVVTDQDRQKFDRAMDGGRAVFTKSDDFDFAWARLGLNEDAEAIAMWIDGTHSAAEIASLSGKDAFNVYKLLHALALLGIVRGAPAEDLAMAGVADASDAWMKPAPPEREPEPQPVATPVRSAFDDEPEPEPEPALQSTPAPPPIAPPSYEQEPNWGFDEAQIETARAATEEEPAEEIVANASKSNRWIALLLGAVVLIGLVFGGFAAWNWWQARNAPPPTAPKVTALPVVRAKRPRVEPPVAAPAPATTTTTTSTAPAAMVVKPVATPPPAKPATAMTITRSTTQVTRNAEGTATITNTASTAAHPASNDAQRAHYDEMAKSFASQAATGAFTIQFELVCETASLTKAIRDGGSSVWFTPISYHNRSCYRVFWGHYPTKDEATRGAREIPLALRGAAPVVVKVPTS
jgi:hypothetical protein